MRKLAQAAGLRRGALSNLGVQRAADGQVAAVEDVGVDHGRFDILVAQELLHCSDITVGFQEVGRKTMAQGVGADRFDDADQAGCLFDRLLQAALVQVMAACDAGTGVLG
jgi:hypothetical protein